MSREVFYFVKCVFATLAPLSLIQCYSIHPVLQMQEKGWAFSKHTTLYHKFATHTRYHTFNEKSGKVVSENTLSLYVLKYTVESCRYGFGFKIFHSFDHSTLVKLGTIMQCLFHKLSCAIWSCMMK